MTSRDIFPVFYDLHKTELARSMPIRLVLSKNPTHELKQYLYNKVEEIVQRPTVPPLLLMELESLQKYIYKTAILDNLVKEAYTYWGDLRALVVSFCMNWLIFGDMVIGYTSTLPFKFIFISAGVVAASINLWFFIVTQLQIQRLHYKLINLTRFEDFHFSDLEEPLKKDGTNRSHYNN
jgi:hypothetical protein